MKILKEYKKLHHVYRVVSEALRIAGKYARENLPAEVPTDPDYLAILANGQERDPDGHEYVAKWLAMAEKNLEA